MLKVPFIKQINEHACGLATLEMICRLLPGTDELKFSQTALFDQYRKPVGNIRGDHQINSDDLVAIAKGKGFALGLGRVSTNSQKMLKQVRHFIETEGVPLVACQSFKENRHDVGHFRVVVAADRDGVSLLDPRGSGDIEVWSVGKMMKFWKPNGGPVTGGIAIWVADREIKDVLSPTLPNEWQKP